MSRFLAARLLHVAILLMTIATGFKLAAEWLLRWDKARWDKKEARG